jgi:hypothetical protein
MAIWGQGLADNGMGMVVLILYGLSFCFFNFGPG